MPENRNVRLIVFFRGSSPQAERFDGQPYAQGGRAIMRQRGFALVQSRYARTGWNIADAHRDTEWVRGHFIATPLRP